MGDPSLVASRELYASKRFALSEESWATVDGTMIKPAIHHPGAVAIIAQPRASEVVLVRQFRYAVRRWTLEIPAGTCELDEQPELTAARELREEAGFACEKISEIFRFYPAVGVSDELLILYRGEGLSRVPAAPELGELVSPEVVSITDLPRLFASGDICDAKTIIAISILGLTVPTRLGSKLEAHG